MPHWQLPGFDADEEPHYTTTGFARNALMQAAPAVIDQVKAGNIKHFFLIGGCDGSKAERSYYTDLAKAVPDDSIILTLACGKFRFNDLEFGDINGIPRFLDVGQCNDAYLLPSSLRWHWPMLLNVVSMTCRCHWYSPGSNKRRS